MSNCENNLIICMDKQRKKNTPEKTVNKIYEKMFENVIQNIKTNKDITIEQMDFIESLSNEKKMEIIKEYNKKSKENKGMIEIIKNSQLR
jgi:hypothetical protein